jgi:hypothetical protein
VRNHEMSSMTFVDASKGFTDRSRRTTSRPLEWGVPVVAVAEPDAIEKFPGVITPRIQEERDE